MQCGQSAKLPGNIFHGIYGERKNPVGAYVGWDDKEACLASAREYVEQTDNATLLDPLDLLGG